MNEILVASMASFIFLTFFNRQGIECASSLSVSWVTFFQANRSRFFTLSSVFGAGSLHVISSIMLQIFSPGFRSGEFAGHSSLGIKLGKFLWQHVWATFEVCAGAPSCTKVIAFFELNNFLSVGPSVTFRLVVNGFTSFSRISLLQYSEVKVWPLGKMCNLVRPRPVIPPYTITFALCFTWYAGGTWHSWDPHTMSCFGFGYWNRYLGHSSVNKKSSQSSAESLEYFLANVKRALLCFSLRSGIFFRLKAFHPLLVIYRQTVECETLIFWRWRFLAIFLVELLRLYLAFSITFLARFVKTDCRPLLGLSSKDFLFDNLFTHLSVFFNNLAIYLTEWPEDRKIAAWALAPKQGQ